MTWSKKGKEIIVKTLLGSEVDFGNIRIILHQVKCLMTEVCRECSQCDINTAETGNNTAFLFAEYAQYAEYAYLPTHGHFTVKLNAHLTPWFRGKINYIVMEKQPFLTIIFFKKRKKAATKYPLINIELQPEVVISEERPQIRSTQAITS